MDKLKRVCCLCERWESGGIESFLCNVLTRMESTALNVDIVVASLVESVFTEVLQNPGVNFIELSGSRRNILENHRRFRKLLRARKYDVLHLNAFQGLSLAYLKIAQDEGVPIRIAHSHNTALRKSAARPLKLAIHRWARRRYTRYATHLWACSKNAAEFLFAAKELQKHSFQFVPNGIDVERFRFDPTIRTKVRAELGLEKSFVIGNIGRLCFQKNQAFLLDVLTEALKQNPQAILLIVGNGEDKSALIKKASDLHIADKVIFYGVTNHPEHHLWAMDTFAFPSLFEGLGIAVIEAQAAGLPVICSEHIPQEAYVTKQIHSVPLPWGAAAWADALLATGERYPDGADKVRSAGFDISDMAQQIEASYLGADVYGRT